MNFLDNNSWMKPESDGRRQCVIPTKCEPATRIHGDLMAAEWEELVIRYDKHAGKYVMRTASRPGAPVCC